MDDVSPSRFTIDRISTPIGIAVFVTDAQGLLTALDWEDFETRLVERLRARAGKLALLSTGKAPPALRDALTRYFDGDVHAVVASCEPPPASPQALSPQGLARAPLTPGGRVESVGR